MNREDIVLAAFCIAKANKHPDPTGYSELVGESFDEKTKPAEEPAPNEEQKTDQPQEASAQ